MARRTCKLREIDIFDRFLDILKVSVADETLTSGETACREIVIASASCVCEGKLVEYVGSFSVVSSSSVINTLDTQWAYSSRRATIVLSIWLSLPKRVPFVWDHQ